MPDTLLPELHRPETRQALAESVLAVLDDWGVHGEKQAVLLGLADTAPLRQGQPLPDNPGVLERTGHLLGIERALRRLYPADPVLRHEWLMVPDAGLGGQLPLVVMLDGLEGIKQVRARLETSLHA